MADLLNVGVTALTAYRRSLETAGHNIANVNTDGYSRQRVELSAARPTLEGVGYIGNGVSITGIERVYNEFLTSQVRSAQSATSHQETLFSFAERIDNLLAKPEIGLTSAVQSLFDAVQGMSDDPASIASRQEVLSEANALTDRFHHLYNQYDSLRGSINRELELKVDETNALAQSIADINQAIVAARGASGGFEPADLLDQRDVMLKDLAKLIDVSTLPQDDGAINVFIGKGQSIVIGNRASTLSVTQNPTDSLAPDISISLGSVSQSITSYISGGEFGGLLQFRSDFIDQGQNQLGLVAIGLIEATNAQHVLGIDLLSRQGGDLFASHSTQGKSNFNNTGDGTVDITFSSTAIADLTSSDYELVYNGGGMWTMTRLSDGYAFPAFNQAAPPAMDGFDLSFTAGGTAWAAGDSFLVQPTRDAADNIQFLIDDPNRLAAAGSLRSAELTDANGNPVNTGTATISQADIGSTTGIPLGVGVQMTFQFTNNAGGTGNPGFNITNGPAAPNDYILYDPASSDRFGKTFPDGAIPGQFALFGDLTFEMSGVPAVGDQFLIEDNTGGTADNRSALALGGLQSSFLMLGGTATFQGTYSQLVSSVGSMTHFAEINYRSQEGLLQSHEDSLLSVSGVNLDEEAANLLKFQQAYQAAAQMINISETMFETLMGAVRR